MSAITDLSSLTGTDAHPDAQPRSPRQRHRINGNVGFSTSPIAEADSHELARR